MHRPVLRVLLATLVCAGLANACRGAVGLDIRDVLLADVVVSGRLYEYHITGDAEARLAAQARREAYVESMGSFGGERTC